jgi:hypothetical protein
MRKLYHSTQDHEILYADRYSKDGQVWTDLFFFAINQKYEHGWRLKLKIHNLFYGDNLRTAAIRQLKMLCSERLWVYLQVLF